MSLFCITKSELEKALAAINKAGGVAIIESGDGKEKWNKRRAVFMGVTAECEKSTGE